MPAPVSNGYRRPRWHCLWHCLRRDVSSSFEPEQMAYRHCLHRGYGLNVDSRNTHKRSCDRFRLASRQ